MVVGGIIVCILAVAVIGIFAFLRQPSFGKLPSGERLERIRRSPNYQGGQFRNLQPTAMMTGKKSRWQALWEFVVSDRSGLYPEKPVPSVKTDLKQLPRTESGSLWIPCSMRHPPYRSSTDRFPELTFTSPKTCRI